MRANLALFYIKWNDQQQSVPDDFGSLYIDNIGEMTSTGLELELTALPVKDLEVSYNLGLTDTEYQTLLLTNADGELQNFEGNKQVFTPAFTSGLTLNYKTSLSDDLDLFVVPKWNLLGKQYFTYYNDLVQDAYSLFHLNLGVKYKSYELSLWGKNLFDTKYLSFAYATSTGAATQVLYGAPPRTFGVTLRANF